MLSNCRKASELGRIQKEAFMAVAYLSLYVTAMKRFGQDSLAEIRNFVPPNTKQGPSVLCNNLQGATRFCENIRIYRLS